MKSTKQTTDPEHFLKMQEFLSEHGPCSSRAILNLLNPDDSEEGFRPSLICMLHCPGTWHIAIGEDNGLVGLESHDKPGDGSEAAAAESLGLVEMMGAWVPRKYLNDDSPTSRPVDLEYLKKMEDAQSMHSIMMRHHGITVPDEIVADWNRRDPEAPWGSGKVGRYIRQLTALCFDFMAAKIKEAGGPEVAVDHGECHKCDGIGSYTKHDDDGREYCFECDACKGSGEKNLSAELATWSVYQLNDCDWWVARSLTEAIVDALRECYHAEVSDDPTPEELLKFEGAELCDARELTAEEMDRLIFIAVGVDDDAQESIERTFREELAYRIEAGTIVVGMLASTEG